jgi:Lon protease-like protein
MAGRMERFDDKLLSGGIPIFPLPNCVLLPGAVLPLHLFEPRYCKMMRDLLKHESRRRLIAMALLKDGYESLYHTNQAAIHRVLCVGQVVHHEELADGRFNVLLLGCCRATVRIEDKTSDYRVAQLRPLEASAAALDEAGALSEVRELLNQAVELEICSAEVVSRLLEAAPSLETLVDLLAFHFIPGDESELKQRVLEESSMGVRVEIVSRRLAQLMEQRRRAQERSSTETWPPPPNVN